MFSHPYTPQQITQCFFCIPEVKSWPSKNTTKWYQPVKKQNSGAWRVTPETLVVSLIVNILSIDEDFAGRIETMWIPETYIHLVIPCPFLGKLSTNLGCSTYCISHHQPDLGPVSRRFAVTMCGGKGVDDCGCIHILYVLEVS